MKKFHDVLVINNAHVPTNIVNFEKAISLIINEKAYALDSDYVHYNLKDWLEFSRNTRQFKIIRGVNIQVALPHTVALKTYTRLYNMEKGVSYSRQSVLERDQFCCAYCAKKLTSKECSIDHVIPLSKKGGTSFKNCVTCCLPCNSRKANRTPEEAGMKLLIDPTVPKWVGRSGKIPDLESWSRFLGNVESNPEHGPAPQSG